MTDNIVMKMTCQSVTKRVRGVPDTFDSLKTQVTDMMSKSKNLKKEKQFLLKGDFSITYEDDTGDLINVSDDEDLQSAYEFAEGSSVR